MSASADVVMDTTSLTLYTLLFVAAALSAAYSVSYVALWFMSVFSDGWCYAFEVKRFDLGRFPTVRRLLQEGYNFPVYEVAPGLWHLFSFDAFDLPLTMTGVGVSRLSELSPSDRVGATGNYNPNVQGNAYAQKKFSGHSKVAGVHYESGGAVAGAHASARAPAGMAQVQAGFDLAAAVTSLAASLSNSKSRAHHIAKSVPSRALVRRNADKMKQKMWYLSVNGGLSTWLPSKGIADHLDPEAVQVPGLDHWVSMSPVDAMEAVKILNSATDAIGEASERMANAADLYRKGLPTAVAPSDPAFTKLTRLVGPLVYKPKIAGHAAASTLRRAALAQASRAMEGAIVGLVSPSYAEMHTFPNGAFWLYNDGQIDSARRAKHCSLCKAPVCHIKQAALKDARVFDGNKRSKAAEFFARFQVQYLLLLNIEPNLAANDLLELMVDAGIWNAYSLASVDWRVLAIGSVNDNLIGMQTRREANNIISSFDDAGDYLQPIEHVRQMFKPTTIGGHALRRTVLFGEGATWYYELNVMATSVATRCLPGVSKSYFLRIPSPSSVDTVVMVERSGFDRVLSTYRTQAIKDLETAKIVLRQSNVTYSIAGTQVTPRLSLSNSEYEALAVWLVVYSAVQDAIADRTRKSLIVPGNVSLVSTGIWQGVKDRLAATSGGQMALGTYSAVDEALGAYRRSIAEKTIDQLSDDCILELFGPKISPTNALGAFIKKWGNVFSRTRELWEMKSKISPALMRSWHLSFGFVDLMATFTLFGLRFSASSVGVILDLLLFVCRVTGSLEAANNINRFERFVNWPTTKYELFWVEAQKAQSLDFQAAVIDIVETFYNTFSTDHAAELQEHQEKLRQQRELTQAEMEAHEILNEQARLPYSDFLSEVKLFLGRFNTRASRYAAVVKLLHAFRVNKRAASAAQLERMIHTLEKEARVVTAEKSATMHFALGGEPELIPLPISLAVRGGKLDNVREVFDNFGVINFKPSPVQSTLERLRVVDGMVDFTPIHERMEFLHPGGDINPHNFREITSISPDERGAELQKKLIDYGALMGHRTSFAPQDSLRLWYNEQLTAPGLIAPVADILHQAEGLLDVVPERKWLAHIEGLAMGGKSAGVRKWVTNEDLIIVPTQKLRDEWEHALGLLQPLQRASVVTMHKALVHKFVAGYVIIDEAITMDPQLLQLLANRHSRCKGMITIGDGHQIGNVFTESAGLDATQAPLKMVSPVSFCPWDALATYLAMNSSPIRAEKYYCGSNSATGLVYAIRANEVLIPGDNDSPLTGTQAAKQVMHMRGLVETVTVHEAQGSRARNVIYHTDGSLRGDVNWLSKAEQNHHLGVMITRAREKTVFVVDALSALTAFTWVSPGINGVLPNTCIFGGTFWDMVDPRVIDEACEEYIHEAALQETTLRERPLTNPITIGTVFVDGEAVSKSELRSEVALTSGVKFTDLGIKNSDAFDDYLIQPRDVPGVDQIQALTRAIKKPRPTYRDFVDAEVIVNRIFDQVLDPKIFFAHINNTRRNVINRRERSQIIDGCEANLESKMSVLSFGFLKPEFAKKQSELSSVTGGELKAQGVITASAAQQAIFMDACDALTHAWARAMRPGKFSPVGFKEADVDGVLSTFESTYELDLEKQDSSHAAVHVLVACRFLEMAADKLGLAAMAEEIRTQRVVRMMKDPFTFVLQMALASGDPWTLIFNKIMAVSSLISVSNLAHVRFMQTGDDITLDRQPDWDRRERLKAQHSANRGLTWKAEERAQREAGVTFISRGALPNRTIVYKALRTVLKYTARKRDRLQHASFASDTRRLMNASSKLGLMAYVEARCRVFGGDPAVVHDMWARAIDLALTPFDKLPEHLKSDDGVGFQIISKDVGCFGYALAHCVQTNVQAINAIAFYPRTTDTATAVQACKDNRVEHVRIDESWAKRSRSRLHDAILAGTISLKRAFVAIYNDHAVAVKPKELVVHNGLGKQVFKWATLHVNGVVHYDGL